MIAVLISLAAYYLLEDNGLQKSTAHPYYVWFVLLIGGVYLLALLGAFGFRTWRGKLLYKAPLLAGVIMLFAVINTVTTKTRLLPTLYFPSLDRIIGLLFEQRIFLLENVWSSIKIAAGGKIYLNVNINSKRAVTCCFTYPGVTGPDPTSSWPQKGADQYNSCNQQI